MGKGMFFYEHYPLKLCIVLLLQTRKKTNVEELIAMFNILSRMADRNTFKLALRMYHTCILCIVTFLDLDYWCLETLL